MAFTSEVGLGNLEAIDTDSTVANVHFGTSRSSVVGVVDTTIGLV